MFDRRGFIGSALAVIAGLIGWKSSSSPHMPIVWNTYPKQIPCARLFERATGREIVEEVLRCNPDTGYYECCLPGLTGKPFVNAEGDIATEIRKAEGGISIEWDA